MTRVVFRLLQWVNISLNPKYSAVFTDEAEKAWVFAWPEVLVDVAQHCSLRHSA